MDHILALYVGTIGGRIMDFQLSNDDTRRIQDKVPNSPKYFVFDTYGFDAKMG
jgi:hypothetical protein